MDVKGKPITIYAGNGFHYSLNDGMKSEYLSNGLIVHEIVITFLSQGVDDD